MRAALWLLALFATAAMVALFAGNNDGTITVFWPPWRVDLSLNLVLLGLAVSFVVLHLALRALSALFSLPVQARRWRTQQKERALHVHLLDAIVQIAAGRFSRARKAADAALLQEKALAELGTGPAHAQQLRAVAHLLAAESAQSLQDADARELHLGLALETGAAGAAGSASSVSPETREGIQLRAAYWALQDHHPEEALRQLADLPQGAQRRTLALRLRLKACRQSGQALQALETARLLAKHSAFSKATAQSILRELAMEGLSGAIDEAQLVRVWSSLDTAERSMPEVAMHGAGLLMARGGDAALSRDWLLPVWDRIVAQSQQPDATLRIKLARALEPGLSTIDSNWLSRIEAAQQNDPRDPHLQYLAGMACLKRQLWGKARQLLLQATPHLSDETLKRQAWTALARLAEARDDAVEATAAWKQAAQTQVA